MKKRNKSKKGFYEVIKDLRLKQDKEQALIELQSLAYIYILSSDVSNLPLKVEYPKDGEIYCVFKDNYNNEIRVDYSLVISEYRKAISYIVPRKPNSIKKRKKYAVRIKKEMQRMRKNHWIGEDGDLTKNSIRDFQFAIKESFIIIRNKLIKDAFDVLPKELDLRNGDKIKTSEYFVQSELSNGFYEINKEIAVSMTDKRYIQYQIADLIIHIVRKD